MADTRSEVPSAVVAVESTSDSTISVVPKTMNRVAGILGLRFHGPALPPVRPQKVVAELVAKIPYVSMEGHTDGAYKRAITSDDWNQTQVRAPGHYAAGLTDYIHIGLKGRGVDGGVLKKRFLVNPDTISVNYDVRDSEAQARGGWMIGVWGDLGQVTLSGWSAGRYFAGGLNDAYSDYTISYQNLQDLMLVYENNGVFYEGEDVGGGPVPLLAARKQVRSHADVILRFGNFIWEGYFTDMKVDDSAEHPYASKFIIGFQVLRESYAATSPWRGSVTLDGANEVRYRGHAWELYGKAAQTSERARRQSDIQASAIQQGIMSRKLEEQKALSNLQAIIDGMSGGQQTAVDYINRPTGNHY